MHAHTHRFNVFCVEQTGKSYTVVSGHDGTQDHVDRILTVAKEMMTESRKVWGRRFVTLVELVRVRRRENPCRVWAGLRAVTLRRENPCSVGAGLRAVTLRRENPC
eukprot:366541-Chlamydomonas_euryale.AAC.1